MSENNMAAPIFRDLPDVDAYVKEHGKDYLRRLLMQPASMHMDCRRVAECWFYEQEEKDRERSVLAAESSAQSALEAVKMARNSARWAMWAVIVAVAALSVSAWPYLAPK